MMSSINLKIFMSNSSQISFSEIDEYMRLYFSYIASLVTILICDDNMTGVSRLFAASRLQARVFCFEKEKNAKAVQKRCQPKKIVLKVR